jgi:hypothetical protein
MTGRGPQFQFRVARRPHLQQVVVASIAQLEPGDGLSVASIEALREPENRRQRPHGASRTPSQVAESVVASLGSRLAMIPCHQRDDLDFFRLEASQVAVLDQIVRMFVVTLVTDVHADIVQDRCVLEPLALAIGQAVDGARLIEQRHRQPGHLLRVFRPVIAPLGQLEDAPPPDVRISIGLRDLFAMLRNVIQNEAFSERQVAQGELGCAQPPQDLVHQNHARHDQIGAARFETGNAQPLVDAEADDLLAQPSHLLRRDPPVAQRLVGRAAFRCRDHGTDAQNGAGCSDDTVEPRPCNLVEVLADFGLDVPDELPLVLWSERIAFDKAFGESNDAQLEAPAELDCRALASRNLDAAAPDVDDDGDVTRSTHAVHRGRMNVTCLLRPGYDPWSKARVIRHRLQELAAIFGFAGGTRRDGDNFLNAMGFGQTPEFRQHLKCCMHRLRRERSTIQAAGAKPDHFFFPVDHLE